ncbi:carboxypeptidase N subunit 2-like [Melitaea cinxia]|uniref:carboxypeptidase N subunit 2-like n=1 Tax=Melitaea cinxia TaxID=113334 RepID=UPI001E26FEC8|nr:carboxypeptidase N subunit 2-like [Melitaea cinxia]
MAKKWRDPDKVCWDEPDGFFTILNCTLPSKKLILQVNEIVRALMISCSENSTLVCNELEEVKRFSKKYKDTGSTKETFNSISIDTCNISNESLSCLLGVMGVNGTDQVKLQRVTGTLEPVHLEGLEGVTHLEMYDVDKSLTSVPYNALSLLSNLEIFSMKKAFIELTSESNYVLSKLTIVTLDECRIKSVPKGAFKATPEITHLSLRRNTMESIEVDAFEGLTELVWLDLNENLLTHLPEGVFRHIPNIIEIDLKMNKLLNLSDDLFTGLNKLKERLIPMCNQAHSNISQRNTEIPLF